MMPRRQGVRKCDSFESMCCELKMHVCDLETNCFFGEIFFEHPKHSSESSVWSIKLFQQILMNVCLLIEGSIIEFHPLGNLRTHSSGT